MPGDLSLRCFELKPGIPAAAIRTVESAAERVGLRKGRVDDNEPVRIELPDARYGGTTQ